MRDRSSDIGELSFTGEGYLNVRATRLPTRKNRGTVRGYEVMVLEGEAAAANYRSVDDCKGGDLIPTKGKKKHQRHVGKGGREKNGIKRRG